MTAKELYNLKSTPNEGESGTFDEFISEFEEKWLQYSEKWKAGHELFENEKSKAFPKPYRFSN